MREYILLIVLPTMVYLLYFRTKNIRYRSYAYFLFFALLIIMLTFRADYIGNDTLGYIYKYKVYSQASIKNILSEREPLYGLLNYYSSMISDDYHFLFFVCAFISAVPIYYLFSRYSSKPILTISIFLILSNFVLLFSGLRQSISIAIGIIAFEFIRKRKIIPYFFCVFVAFLFHNSAFMLLFMWPLYYLKINGKGLLLYIPLLIAIYYFRSYIFLFFLEFVSDLYIGTIKETGAGLMLILLILFAIFVFVIPDKKELSKDFLAMRNYLLFAIIIQIFASINSIVMRIGYYYLIFIPPLISLTIEKSALKYQKLSKFANIFMSLFFILYFLYIIQNKNLLNIYPYNFFWE